MRKLSTLALAAAIPLVACSSAPGDPPVATTSAALTPSCDPGEKLVCGGPIGVPVHGTNPPPQGNCVCEYLSCSNLVVPPLAAETGSFNIAWAKAGTSCPDIVTSQGTWAQINSRPQPASWSEAGDYTWTGVPGLWANYASYGNVGNVCEQVLKTTSCCTYVWWPKGYDTSTDPLDLQGKLPTADTQALCGGAAYTAVSVYYFDETLIPVSTDLDGGYLRPGGGGRCGACTGT